MTSAMVSNVAVPVQPVNSNARDTKKVSEETDVSFQNLLTNPKQSAKQPVMAKSDANQAVAKGSVNESKKESETAYEKNSKRDAVKIEDAKEQPKVLSDEQKKAVEEATDTFAEGVKEVIEEELDVTEEEILDVMETLGLTFLDLTQQDNLVPLVAELTGTEEPLELLTNQNMNGIMDQVSELVTNLTEETGIPAEELTALGMTETDEAVPEDIFIQPADAAVSTAEATETFAVNEEAVEMTEELAPEAELPKETVRTGDTTALDRTDRQGDEKAEAPEVRPLAEAEAPERPETNMGGSTGENDADAMGGSAEKTGDTDIFASDKKREETGLQQEQEHFTVQHSQHTETAQPVVNAPEAEQVQRPVVDPRELMEQFQEFARTSITTDTTSIEMRLNPENLGRLLINVQEQEGNVRATIQTANQEVREALESQIAVLKSTLEGQGVKVTEVEVTVASHEFEENLEKGNTGAADSDQQEHERSEQEQRGTGSGRRNLHVNDLDSLSGLLSEEEVLAAQIMQDHGNTMDYKA